MDERILIGNLETHRGEGEAWYIPARDELLVIFSDGSFNESLTGSQYETEVRKRLGI